MKQNEELQKRLEEARKSRRQKRTRVLATGEADGLLRRRAVVGTQGAAKPWAMLKPERKPKKKNAKARAASSSPPFLAELRPKAEKEAEITDIKAQKMASVSHSYVVYTSRRLIGLSLIAGDSFCG